MISEKVLALAEAVTTLATRGSTDKVNAPSLIVTSGEGVV